MKEQQWMDRLGPEDEAEVDKLCMRTLFERARLAAMLAPFGTLFIAWLVLDIAPFSLVLTWVLLNCVPDAVTFVLSSRWLRHPPPHERIPHVLNWQIVLRVVQGLSWGMALVLFHTGGHVELINELVILLVLISISAVSVTNMAPSFVTMLTFCAAILFVPFVHFLMQGEALYLNLAVGLVILFMVEMQIGWDAWRQFREGVRQLVLNRRIRRELELRNAQLDALNRDLQVMAIHDQLTGLYNRHFIVEQLERQRELFQRHGSLCSIVLLDIDHFKQVNDRFGHAVGDEVLREFSRRIESLLRQGDMLGRYGGEEFLLVLPMADSEAAAKLAERVRQRVEETPLVEGAQTIYGTASFGVAQLAVGEGVDDWLERADQALYRAKSLGRNRVIIA
jgi:diguanylate cyclase (GGDEF)-like protein